MRPDSLDFIAIPDPQVDHAMIIAGAAVSQASTRTAVLAERMARQRRQPGDTLGALVHVFAGRDIGAAAHLEGSFHPRVAHVAARRR